MAKQTVEYVINAKDNLSPKLDKASNKAGGLKSMLSSFAPALGVAAIVGGITKIVNVNKDFEKSISTLSSLTGKTGDELNVLKEAAKEMGATTTLSATQAADAMTLIGSKFPDLLQSTKGLKMVTNEAAILAEAAGIDMPSAASALTGALNQFNLSADRSRNVIDALAAGSQAGAADIPYLNSAIEKGGAAAKSAGVSFEEMVGAIETIAPKISEPSTAGLNLKNVFLDLGSGADEFNPKVVGMTAALDNLAKAGFDDVGKASQKFGKINAVAAATLIENRDKFADYTDTVSQSGTALEQQRINNDNLDGSLKSLGSAVEGLAITIGSILEPAVRFGVDALASLATFVSENIDVIGILAVGIGAYAVIANGAAIATSAVAMATKIYTGFQWLLNAALTANPIGLVVAGIALLTAAIVVAYRKSETFRAVLWGLWEGLKAVGMNIIDFLLLPLREVAKVIDFIGGTDLASKLTIGEGVSRDVAGSFNKGFEDGLADFAKDKVTDDESASIFGSVADAQKTTGGLGVSNSASGTVSGDVSGVQGSKVTTINVNIQKLVESLNIQTTNIKEGASQMRDEISKALLTAVNDVNIISG